MAAATAAAPRAAGQPCGRCWRGLQASRQPPRCCWVRRRAQHDSALSTQQIKRGVHHQPHHQVGGWVGGWLMGRAVAGGRGCPALRLRLLLLLLPQPTAGRQISLLKLHVWGLTGLIAATAAAVCCCPQAGCLHAQHARNSAGRGLRQAAAAASACTRGLVQHGSPSALCLSLAACQPSCWLCSTGAGAAQAPADQKPNRPPACSARRVCVGC